MLPSGGSGGAVEDDEANRACSFGDMGYADPGTEWIDSLAAQVELLGSYNLIGGAVRPLYNIIENGLAINLDRLGDTTCGERFQSRFAFVPDRKLQADRTVLFLGVSNFG